MEKKKSCKARAHTRPHTHFKNQRNTSIPQTSRRNDVATQSSEGVLTIDPIKTMYAAPALQQFPPELKTELERYLRSPNATTKTFASTTKHFDLYHDNKNNAACFVEMGTTNVMDAALYHCGPALRRGSIVVVKPKPGSGFNGGKAAMITFYGKGNNHDGRDVVSRWAIWTPNGFRDDILVDRMLVSTCNTDDDGARVPKRMKRTYNRRSPVAIRNANTNDHLSFTPEPVDEHQNPPESAVGEVSRDSVHASGTREETIKVETDINTSDQHILLHDDSFHPDSDHTSMSCRPALFRASAPNPVESTCLSPTGSAICANLSFRSLDACEAHVTKSLAHCNTIQKLFAYARKAGISGPDVIMLSASVGYKSVEVVKDDEDDFNELLGLIRDERALVGQNHIVTVSVTPCPY